MFFYGSTTDSSFEFSYFRLVSQSDLRHKGLIGTKCNRKLKTQMFDLIKDNCSAESDGKIVLG